MSRKAQAITCNENDRIDLEMLASGGHVSPAIQKRARAILLCADGKENNEKTGNGRRGGRRAFVACRKEKSQGGSKWVGWMERPRS